MGYIFRDINDACYFYKFGCFQVLTNISERPIVFDWAISNYCTGRHEIHDLIDERIVFKQSFTAAQVKGFQKFYSTVTNSSIFSEVDCAVIYYARITTFTLVSNVPLILEEAKRCGAKAIATSTLFEQASKKMEHRKSLKSQI